MVADDTLYLLWVLVSVDNEGARRALLVVILEDKCFYALWVL